MLFHVLHCVFLRGAGIFFGIPRGPWEGADGRPLWGGRGGCRWCAAPRSAAGVAGEGTFFLGYETIATVIEYWGETDVQKNTKIRTNETKTV